MTKTQTSKTCSICSTKLTSNNRCEERDFHDMCQACFDYAGWENHHSDYNHAEIQHRLTECLPLEDYMTEELFTMSECQVCLGNEPQAAVEKPYDASKAHAPQTRSSHAGHNHTSTKAARNACRALQGAIAKGLLPADTAL